MSGWGFLSSRRPPVVAKGTSSSNPKPGKGTRVKATFRHSHIDRAPLGDMPAALLAILLSERPVDLDYCHNVDSREFRFDSSEIRKELEDVPLTHPKVRDWLFQSCTREKQAFSTKGTKATRPLGMGTGRQRRTRRRQDGTTEEHRRA